MIKSLNKFRNSRTKRTPNPPREFGENHTYLLKNRRGQFRIGLPPFVFRPRVIELTTVFFMGNVYKFQDQLVGRFISGQFT